MGGDRRKLGDADEGHDDFHPGIQRPQSAPVKLLHAEGEHLSPPTHHPERRPPLATPTKPAPAPVAAPDPPVVSATVTTTTSASGQPSVLDTSLVLGGLGIIAFVLGCLFFVHDIPNASLPIIAGLAGTLLGTVVGGYAAYRWGASDAMKRSTATSQTTPPAGE